MPYISFLFQKVRICTQWFAGPFSAHLTLNVSLLEFACVHNVPMMEKRCVAQMERPTTTYVSFSGWHAKATLLWRWPEKVHVKVGFRSCISSVCFVVTFGERGATKKTRNAIMTESKNKRRLPFTRKTRKFGLKNEMVQTIPLKVAQNSFQHFPWRRFWWVIITTLYQLMLQPWYRKTVQSLVNTLVLFWWH